MWAQHLREADALDWRERELLPALALLDATAPHSLAGDFGRSGDLTVFAPIATLQTPAAQGSLPGGTARYAL